MYSVSALFGPFLRGAGGVQYAVVDAFRDGAAVATGLPVLGGFVTDDSSAGVRRTLDLELAPQLGLWDLLAPIGTEIRPRMVTRYLNGTTESIPLGVFDIDAQSMAYGAGGSVKLAGSDKWARIQRARFLKPQASTRGITISAQIVKLIQGALGAGEPVNNFATSTATVGSVVWERDRDQTIQDLAKSIGAYVSFDRDGVAEIRDLPTSSATTVWTVDASETGVLLDAQRDRDRKRTYNVVVVASDKADGEAPFAPQIVWDTDPDSPTYAGFNPLTNPGSAGPFGIVPYFYTSPLLRNAGQALDAGRKILARTTGLASQLGLTAIRNHALDSLDPIGVLLPAERYDQEQPFERHIIDRVTHPLLPTGTQTIDTRSTRTDEFT